MLQCLDREHRLAYILGEIMELDHVQAANVLDVSSAAFRKRLSRARTNILSFMNSYCGLVNPNNNCRCHRRLATAITLGRVDSQRLHFASSPQTAKQFPHLLAQIRQLEATRRAAALYQSHSEASQSNTFTLWLRKLLNEIEDSHPIE